MSGGGNPAAAEQADLHALVRLGVGMREVVRHARQVNVAALNAKLASRRQGTAALGFGVAAAALREVADGLGDQMAGLTAEISTMVHGLAKRGRQVRGLAQLHRAAMLHPEAADRLDDMRSRQVLRLDALDARLRDQRVALARRLTGARRLCESGCAIARCAAIEAAHGGVAAVVLGQVAKELRATIDHVSRELADVQGVFDGGPR